MKYEGPPAGTRVMHFGLVCQNIFFFALDSFGRLCQNDGMMKLTKKAFREYLNRRCAEGPKHRERRYQQRKRGYGDYLYFQDRERFNWEYEEWLKQQASQGTAQ